MLYAALPVGNDAVGETSIDVVANPGPCPASTLSPGLSPRYANHAPEATRDETMAMVTLRKYMEEWRMEYGWGGGGWKMERVAARP